jgi:hypothetical protein
MLFQVKVIPLEADTMKKNVKIVATGKNETLMQLKKGDCVYVEAGRMNPNKALLSVNENSPQTESIRFKFGATYASFSYFEIGRIHKFAAGEAVEITTKDGTVVDGSFVDVRLNAFKGSDICLAGQDANKKQSLFVVNEKDIAGIRFPSEK